MSEHDTNAAEIAAESIRAKVAADPSLFDILRSQFGVIDFGLDDIHTRPDIAEIDAALGDAPAAPEQVSTVTILDTEIDALKGVAAEEMDADQLRAIAEERGIKMPASPLTGVPKLLAALLAGIAEIDAAANNG